MFPSGLFMELCMFFRHLYFGTCSSRCFLGVILEQCKCFPRVPVPFSFKLCKCCLQVYFNLCGSSFVPVMKLLKQDWTVDRGGHFTKWTALATSLLPSLRQGGGGSEHIPPTLTVYACFCHLQNPNTEQSCLSNTQFLTFVNYWYWSTGATGRNYFNSLFGFNHPPPPSPR